MRLLLISFAITGCAKFCGPSRADMTPEQVVEAYLDVALNMTEVEEREDLIEFTTDKLKDAIENAPTQVIKEAYVDRNYELLSYSVVERRDRTPRETEITFHLTYHDLGKDPAVNRKTRQK